MLLEIKNLKITYGVIAALRDLSLSIKKGEIIALLGTNGAGKTSALSGISNIIPKSGGKIFFRDTDITDLSASEIVKLGLSHVPEGRRIFSELTVRENLAMGGYTRSRKEVLERIDHVCGIFGRIKERLNQTAGTLSGGEQQMLAIARGLMSSPELLLLDEPSMGLAPVIVEEVFSTISKINAEGTAVLLVEQNAEMALSIAKRGYVLDTGKMALEGTAEKLMLNPIVQEAYLGKNY